MLQLHGLSRLTRRRWISGSGWARDLQVVPLEFRAQN